MRLNCLCRPIWERTVHPLGYLLQLNKGRIAQNAYWLRRFRAPENLGRAIIGILAVDLSQYCSFKAGQPAQMQAE
jgi:hypothetical protein